MLFIRTMNKIILPEKRILKKMTQRDWAKRLEIPESYLSMILKGERNLTRKLRSKMKRMGVEI
jgi:plasmid maintenance system antidote protein VapI